VRNLFHRGGSGRRNSDTKVRLIRTDAGVAAATVSSFEGTQFVRQVPAPHDSIHPAWNGQLRLIGLEVYEDGVVLRWLFNTDKQIGEQDRGAMLLSRIRTCTLEDNRETPYQPSSWAGGASLDGTQRVEISFMPTLPVSASFVKATLAGQEYVVPTT
jgi:hypothetical protein